MVERASHTYAGRREHARCQRAGLIFCDGRLSTFEIPVQIEFVLPFLTFMGSKMDIRIRGEARAIRVEHPSGGRGENGRILV